ncbi:MAG TPA: DUF4331 domain-containing protein [Frankiaceae bacterium]|nr:DUF4331 domain-containing protein [Frankiaceae bacterium]
MSSMSRRRKATGIVTVVAAVTMAPLLLGPGTSSASSHREAPLIAGLPQLDNTDVYAFRSPGNDGTVTLISNWIPFEEPSGGPNFYPFSNHAAYDINIDNNGDGKPDITYQWAFSSSYLNSNTFLYNTGVVHHLTDSTLNFRQVYTLTRIGYNAAGKQNSSTVLAKNVPAAPSDTGQASMPNYATLRSEAIKTIGAGKTFAGQADDPFFLDLRVFDLLYGGNTGGKGFTEIGRDSLAHYNVNTIALKVPLSELALNHNATRNPVVGIWSTTLAKSADGSSAQVSRLGNPLVNEVVVPVALKDAFNSLPPALDHTIAAVVNKVKVPEVPQLVQSIYGIAAPKTPRNDLVEVFLTGISKNSGGPIAVDLNSQLLNKDVNPKAFIPAEELRLNLEVPWHANPSRLGVLGGDTQGYPNGRRLTDDVVDIELQALEGALPPYGRNVSAIGDGVNKNDASFMGGFPYVALPHAG